jgi:cobalt-precorrin-5B (C1)-methyltransferase
MVKLGQGAIDLHSARSQVDFVALADLAAPCGYDHDMVANANSVLDVIQQGAPEMRVKLANAIAAAAQKTALGVIAGAAVNIEILVVARDGQILGTAGTIAP